jgi:hypothetical protein
MTRCLQEPAEIRDGSDPAFSGAGRAPMRTVGLVSGAATRHVVPALLAIVLVAALDWASGRDRGLSLFYALPIIAVSRSVGAVAVDDFKAMVAGAMASTRGAVIACRQRERTSSGSAARRDRAGGFPGGGESSPCPFRPLLEVDLGLAASERFRLPAPGSGYASLPGSLSSALRPNFSMR